MAASMGFIAFYRAHPCLERNTLEWRGIGGGGHRYYRFVPHRRRLVHSSGPPASPACNPPEKQLKVDLIRIQEQFMQVQLLPVKAATLPTSGRALQ